MKYPIRYIPKNITKKDKLIYKKELNKSKKHYKINQYYTRKNISSYKHKKSKYIPIALKLYGLKNMSINHNLSKKTGCSIKTLKKIVNKGKGAYFSSGSRPNQTPQSWGFARLASSITGNKASVIDYNILKNGCSKNSKALQYAKNAIKKYGKILRKTPKINI